VRRPTAYKYWYARGTTASVQAPAATRMLTYNNVKARNLPPMQATASSVNFTCASTSTSPFVAAEGHGIPSSRSDILDIMASRCVARSCSQLTSSTSSSETRAFLQLTPRRYLYNTPLPILDFLLPSVPAPALRHGWTSKRSHMQSKRAFASSARRQQTTAIVNPRKDDDGNDMRVEITPRASNV
jgi:hypothetical protein